MVEFSFGSILKESWEKIKPNYGMVLLIGVVVLIISGVFNFLQVSFKSQGSTGAQLIVGLVSIALNMFLSVGIIRCLLQAADSKKINFSELFSGGDVLLNFFIGHIAYILLCALGMILFIIPGIIWSIKYGFIIYFIVDKNMGIKEAFSQSAQITNGYKWKLFLLMFLIGLINFGGALFFGVGLLITIPWTSLVCPVAFRFLCQEANIASQ